MKANIAQAKAYIARLTGLTQVKLKHNKDGNICFIFKQAEYKRTVAKIRKLAPRHFDNDLMLDKFVIGRDRLLVIEQYTDAGLFGLITEWSKIYLIDLQAQAKPKARSKFSFKAWYTEYIVRSADMPVDVPNYQLYSESPTQH